MTAGILVNEPSECIMRDKRNLAWNDGGKAMVHNVDVEAQKIGEAMSSVIVRCRSANKSCQPPFRPTGFVQPGIVWAAPEFAI
jgi:hypothetical protein